MLENGTVIMAFGETVKEKYKSLHDSIHIDTDPVTIQKSNKPDRVVWEMLARAGL